jgi:lysophospholipase L1-like esterase
MRPRFGFISDDAPALGPGAGLLGLGFQAGAAFNPASFGTCLLSLRGNKNLYTDAAQSVPAVNWNDQVQQWRDEREAQGGSSFPYGNQATVASRPTLAPQAFSVGGVQFTNQRLQLTGLSGVDISNCTLIVTGILVTDYSQAIATVSPAFINVGTVAGGMTLMAFGVNSTLNVQPDANYGSADHTVSTLSLPLGPYTVLSLQSTGTGVVVDVNGTDGAASAAVGSSSVSNGYVGDWSNTNSTCYKVWLGRVLVYAPALSAANLLAVQQGLLAEASLNSLYPINYPLIAFMGDSLTEGVGHGTITPAQTYPAQTLALLTNPAGYLLAGLSGKTIDQVATAWGAGVDAHSLARRTGAQVVSYWAGTNDIAAGTSGATAYATYKTDAQKRKSAGWKVLVFTCMNNQQFTGAQQTQQGNFNTSLRGDFTVATSNPNVWGAANGVTYADYLIDVQNETNLQNTANVTYFSDGTHLTAAGYAIVAADVKTALNALGAS